MADKYERFVAAYLRLNAYFTITNFIVHAADDPTRIYADHVGNYAEADILGIRMPYSAEITGALEIANHHPLVGGLKKKHDVVIAEVKSGKNNYPNSPRTKGKPDPVVSYIVRFVRLHGSDAEINAVASALASRFQFEDGRCRFRYIVFAHKPNPHYAAAGVTYITFTDLISFIVEVRGESWRESNLGVASSHSQWDEVLNDVFKIANTHAISDDARISKIQQYLAT